MRCGMSEGFKNKNFPKVDFNDDPPRFECMGIKPN